MPKGRRKEVNDDFAFCICATLKAKKSGLDSIKAFLNLSGLALEPCIIYLENYKNFVEHLDLNKKMPRWQKFTI